MIESAAPQPAELLIRLLAGREAIVTADVAAWTEIVREANRQGVLSLLYGRIRGLPQGAIPDEFAAGVKEWYTQVALDSAVIFRELDVLIAALQHRDIPVLLLKGSHLAADVYGARAQRTMGDLDVMVPLDRITDAADALTEAGFVMPPGSDTDFAAHCRRSNHIPRMAPPTRHGVGVEVHWHIELPTSPFDIGVAELWSHARELNISGRDVLVLSPEHLLLHLCLHACYHHRFDHAPLKQLCDIAAVIDRYHDIDWETLAGTAERWRVQAYVRFTLLLARNLLNVQVPASALHALPGDPDEARLLENAQAYILNRTMPVPIALTSVMRTRGGLEKMRAGLTRVFPPRDRLAAIYDRPGNSPLTPLWYLVRPFDLLWRNGRATLALLLPGAAQRRLRYREQNRVLLKDALRQWARGNMTSSGRH